MKIKQSLFILPLILSVSITSCVDQPGFAGGLGPRQSIGGGTMLGGGRGYYTTLPRNYVGDAYYYNGRYYSGGNYQTGNYNYQGRTYNNRYYQNGQYLYGGVHQHHGSPSSLRHPSQGGIDYRDPRYSRNYPSRSDPRFVHPSRARY